MVCLLAVVALASGGDRRASDGDASVPSVAPVLDYAYTFGLLAVAGLVALALYLRVPVARRPTGAPEGLLRAAIAVALLGILATVGLDNLRRAAPQETEEVDPIFAQGERPRPNEVGEVEPDTLEFKWKAALGAGAVVAAAAAGAYVVARRRSRASADDEPELAQELALVLDDTLEDLRRERDARRAVIAAYARMERAFAAHGFPRRPFEAPLEYLARVLGNLQVRSSAVLDLTSLFERAKFSPHGVDEAMKDEAITALVAVRDDLEVAA